MDLAAVKLFLEVADAGSLSRVAGRRQIVQSHVSRQIADFEADCGGKLFHRTGRGVVLTELGERAVARLRGWVHQTEQLAEEMRSPVANDVFLSVDLNNRPVGPTPHTPDNV